MFRAINPVRLVDLAGRTTTIDADFHGTDATSGVDWNVNPVSSIKGVVVGGVVNGWVIDAIVENVVGLN